MSGTLQKQMEEHKRIEMTVEDFKTLETWSVPQEEIAQTREDYRQNTLQVQQEIDAELMENIRRQHAEVPVQRAAAVEQPPVQQQAAKESFKEKRERKKKEKEAAENCPVGTAETYDLVHNIQSDLRAHLNSRTREVEERCIEKGVDTRVMLVFCQGYRTDKEGRPASPRDEARMLADQRFFDDYLSGEQERRRPHLDAIVNEILRTPISMDMFSPERFRREGPALKRLADKFVYLENLQKENPDYFNNLPPLQKEMLQAMLPLQMKFTAMLAGHMDTRGVNFNIGEYHSENEPIETGRMMVTTITPMFAEALDTFQAQREEILQREIDRRYADDAVTLGNSYDEVRRVVEENSGPGQEYEKYAGIHFTNYAYWYQYDNVASYRKLIADHPEEYAARKELIDAVYEELFKAEDIGADYYFKTMVVSYGMDGISINSRNPMDRALRGAYIRRMEDIEKEYKAIQHRITALSDILKHELKGEPLSPLGAAALERMQNPTADNGDNE